MEARGEAPGEGGLPVATQAGPGSPGPMVLACGHLTPSYLALFLQIFSTAQGFQDGPVAPPSVT